MTVKPPERFLQPFLHDACVSLYAPSFAVSRPDGQLSGGVDGFYHGDVRALSRLEVGVPGAPAVLVAGGEQGADAALFRWVLRGIAETTADPAVTLTRRRTIEPGRLAETLEVVNAGSLPAKLRLTVAAGTDLAPMEWVKAGRPAPAVKARDTASAAAASATAGLIWSRGTTTVRLASIPAPDSLGPDGVFGYELALAPGESWRADLACTVDDAAGPPFLAPAGGTPAPWSVPEVNSPEPRLARWLSQSFADLQRLLLADPQEHGDLFLAAGAPWFATLFGRDSLWAARMLLPVGTGLAAGTLRVLARRQGTATDAASQEQPGKILHELRRADLGNPFLPPVYYGTVDATPLWLVLLHDAWCWGLDPAQVEPLLPHAEAALAWMRDHGDADGDGFLEYVDGTGRGLANQGWKDSGDAIRFRDGTLAEAPIALSEVQAYAYEAARGGAALLRAFGRPGAEEWEEWSARLKTRFRECFWVTDERGPYPAVALDAAKRPVDSVTSAFGHLLGTGLLGADESALLADRLTAPDMNSGLGLRTLSAASRGFNPLGYHIGSVWPHDTAIAVFGLARAGFPGHAATLATGLMRAADGFRARLPELFAGYPAGDHPAPVPYPASCRPQAWSAASAVLVLQSLLGLSPGLPNARLSVDPHLPPSWRPLTLTGLRAHGAHLAITVPADGPPTVETAGDGVRSAPQFRG